MPQWFRFAMLPWVAEPFSKWGEKSARQKIIENFCGVNRQMGRHQH